MINRLPARSLNLSIDYAVNTFYTIVSNDSFGSLPYLVAKREPRDQFSSSITAINYDARYYLNDKDFTDLPVDNTPIYIRYDQLDINLARLYQMQRGELPEEGNVYFVVESGVLVSSSSAYRPKIENIYRYKHPESGGGGDRNIYYITFPDTQEVPAVSIGDWPAAVNVYLTVKGNLVGRGGDGGIAQHGIGVPSTYPQDENNMWNRVKVARNGFAGAPAIENNHPSFYLTIDGGVVARGGSGGGASSAGYSGGLSYTINGVCGGAPYGRVLSNVNPELELDLWRDYAYSFRVSKSTDASKDEAGIGFYHLVSGGSFSYATGTSGKGGNWGKLGDKSNNASAWGEFRGYGAADGQPGPGGPAIIGLAPVNLTIINGGQILETI